MRSLGEPTLGIFSDKKYKKSFRNFFLIFRLSERNNNVFDDILPSLSILYYRDEFVWKYSKELESCDWRVGAEINSVQCAWHHSRFGISHIEPYKCCLYQRKVYKRYKQFINMCFWLSSICIKLNHLTLLISQRQSHIWHCVQ